MGWPRGARRWSDKEIRNDTAEAKALFRKKRLSEPKKRYLDAFAQLEKANKEIIDRLAHILDDSVDSKLIATLVGDEHLLTALRYLGAPPISKDDLETLIDASLSPAQIANDFGHAKAIRDVIRRILDPKRFPWICERRQPTKNERHAAILASSVVASAQRVQTERRSDERDSVEGAVKELLLRLGFQPTPSRRKGIQTLLADAPKKGEFMIGCKVGEHNADIVAGLFDGRILALECKASNSEINSRKRINKEVAVDAAYWVRHFGEQNLVPAAAIQGGFNAKYLIQAQETPVVIFWAHRLRDLEIFIKTTKGRG
ncbi:MAG: XamI family restriction endonuclease [Alphaproteobacteria bacterium]|nr:XamI family restriction endonuclease [Alphaproteobacteria bacterium]